jgi:hypothetical protein
MNQHVTPGLIPVCACDQCRSFVTRSTDNDRIQTLVDCPEPLDSNDAFHWQCWFCGFSKLPALWGSFFGVPTRPMVGTKIPDDTLHGQKTLFT